MVSYEQSLSLKLFSPKGKGISSLYLQDSFFGFSFLELAYDASWPGSLWIYPVWGVSACLLPHFEKFQPLILWKLFQARPLTSLLEFWWQAHQIQRSRLGSVLFAVCLLLSFTLDDSPAPAATSPILLPPFHAATESACWGSEFQSFFSSNFSAWCFLVFSVSLWRLYLLAWRVLTIGSWSTFITWPPTSHNSCIFVTSVLVSVDCLFYFSWNFPGSQCDKWVLNDT